jgi:hypothetical protein
VVPRSSWISNITGNLLDDPRKGLYLFIWTSSLMFVLRFVAGPIVRRITRSACYCAPHASAPPTCGC